MTVTLSWPDIRRAARVGVERHLAALDRQLPDKHGYAGDGWSIHIEGAIGECAVAHALGRPWDASVNTFKSRPDVGPVEVRTRSRDDYELIVRVDDRDDSPYVLVVGRAPTYRVVGWCWGHEAKRPEWVRTHGDRPPAYFVPQSALRPL